MTDIPDMTMEQLQSELSKYKSKGESAKPGAAKDMFQRLAAKIQAEIDGRKQ